jgi:4-hydroxythreonine-4-phosphate dehydrogenase
MKKAEKIKIGISIGDTNGIGIEVILKTFLDSRMLDFCTPILFGSSKVISHHKKALNLNVSINGISNFKQVIEHKINLFNVWKEDVVVEFGQANKIAGKYAFLSLSNAVEALKDGDIDVLVTAPINKENIQSDDFKFQGHTEYLSSKLNGEELMILMTDTLRVGLITGHIPIQDVAKTITPELIEKQVAILYDSLVKDFNIRKPKIAILGLNPHCGDNGVIGDEDQKVVLPTIEKIKSTGKLVYGPYAADSFFGSEAYKQFDGILAMYHDQGLAPFKTLSFGKGVNFTAGLDKVRTSPDHGTAYEIAGKNKANEASFKEAIFIAIEIYKNRLDYKNLTDNVLKSKRGR